MEEEATSTRYEWIIEGTPVAVLEVGEEVEVSYRNQDPLLCAYLVEASSQHDRSLRLLMGSFLRGLQERKELSQSLEALRGNAREQIQKLQMEAMSFKTFAGQAQMSAATHLKERDDLALELSQMQGKFEELRWQYEALNQKYSSGLECLDPETDPDSREGKDMLLTPEFESLIAQLEED